MDFYIFEDSSDLENLPLLNIEWTLILRLCFLGDLFKLCFFTRCLYFHHNWWRERGAKINFSTIFEGCYLILWGKKLKIYKHSWLLIVCIFKKLNSIQTLFKDIPEIMLSHWSLLSKTYKKSHSITWTLTALNKFVLS